MGWHNIQDKYGMKWLRLHTKFSLWNGKLPSVTQDSHLCIALTLDNERTQLDAEDYSIMLETHNRDSCRANASYQCNAKENYTGYTIHNQINTNLVCLNIWKHNIIQITFLRALKEGCLILMVTEFPTELIQSRTEAGVHRHPHKCCSRLQQIPSDRYTD